MQLAMSSRIQEAANWSWLVPKGLGPKALFGCWASPGWAEVGNSKTQPRSADALPLPRGAPPGDVSLSGWPWMAQGRQCGLSGNTGNRTRETPKQWRQYWGALRPQDT